MSAPLAVDALVLDIDGVIVDVSESYRRTIVETVNRELGASITRDDVQRFKEAGGFNNDWALTAAAALFVRAQRAGLDGDVESFTAAVAECGGGPAAAETVVTEGLSSEAAASVLDDWDPDRLRDVFQALYLGESLYRELEGGSPPIEAPGYIHQETVLMSESTWRTLTEYEVGILTGRPAAEASIALDRAGVTVPPERRITMEDVDAGKPDPSGLLTLVERCDAHATCFVGDTVDDVRTTLRAAEADPGRRYFAVGVLTGGLRGDRGRRVFAEEGADRVVETVNEVPSSITHLPSS